MKKTKNSKRNIIISLIALCITGGLMLLGAYQIFFAGNINRDYFLQIPKGSTYEAVFDSLSKNKVLKNEYNFTLMAGYVEYKNNVKSGRFELKKGMGNRAILRKLQSGIQSPVKLRFNNIRTMEQLAGRVSKQLDIDSLRLLHLLCDNQYLYQFGMDAQTVPAMFIPNTYELYWNTSAEKFIERMHKEYQNFWNEKRSSQQEKIGLSKIQISTLASIVEEETTKNDEKANVASVYLNRLKKGMRLQADPTVKFAVGDFTLRRILNVHLQADSPYNTYKYAGLPPGPICIPSIASIDAVLQNKQTNYLYFCAKDDFSGYHSFATNHNDHIRFAQKYRKALNERNIR